MASAARERLIAGASHVALLLRTLNRLGSTFPVMTALNEKVYELAPVTCS